MKNKIRTLYIMSVTINVSYMLLLNALHFGTNKTDRFRSTKIIDALLKQKFWLTWLEAEQCEGKSHRVHFCVFLHECGCTQGELKILIRLISRPYGPPLLYRSNCTSFAELYLRVCVHANVCIDCQVSLVRDHSSFLRQIYGIISVLLRNVSTKDGQLEKKK